MDILTQRGSEEDQETPLPWLIDSHQHRYGHDVPANSGDPSGGGGCKN